MKVPDRVEHLERPEGCVLEMRIFNAEAGRSLVLTNGLGCGDAHWRYLLDDFARDYRVVTWDLRGQGASTAATGPGAYSASALAGDLAAVQRAAGAVTALHVGFGIGAMIALEHHNWSTDEVEALVLIQGGLPSGQGRLPRVVEAGRRALAATTPLASVGAAVLRRSIDVQRAWRLARGWGLTGHTLGIDDFEGLIDEALEQSVASQFAILRALSSHRPVDSLSKVKVPTLVFGATRDPFYPEALSSQLHESLHNSEYVRLVGAGHSCLLEFGPVIAARVRRFLDERRDQHQW